MGEALATGRLLLKVYSIARVARVVENLFGPSDPPVCWGALLPKIFRHFFQFQPLPSYSRR